MEIWTTVYGLRDLRDIARIIGNTKNGKIDSYSKKEAFCKVRKLSDTMQNAVLRAMIILGLLKKEEKAVKGAVSFRVYHATSACRKLCKISATTKIGEKLSEKEIEFFRKHLLTYTPAKRALFFFKGEPGSKDFERLAREIFPEFVGKYSIETLEERSKALYYVLREANLVDARYRLTDTAQSALFPLREVAKLFDNRFDELYRIVKSPENFRGGSLNYLVAYKDPFIGELLLLIVYVKTEAVVDAKATEAIRMLEDDEKPAAVIVIAPGVKSSYTQRVRVNNSTIPLHVIDVGVLLGAMPVWLPQLRKTITETFKSGTGVLLEALLKTSTSKHVSLSDLSKQVGVRESCLKGHLQEMATLGLMRWFANRIKNEDVFWISHNGKRVLKNLRDLARALSKTR